MADLLSWLREWQCKAGPTLYLDTPFKSGAKRRNVHSSARNKKGFYEHVNESYVISLSSAPLKPSAKALVFAIFT